MPKADAKSIRLPNDTWALIDEFSADFGRTSKHATITIATRVVALLERSDAFPGLSIPPISRETTPGNMRLDDEAIASIDRIGRRYGLKLSKAIVAIFHSLKLLKDTGQLDSALAPAVSFVLRSGECSHTATIQSRTKSETFTNAAERTS